MWSSVVLKCVCVTKECVSTRLSDRFLDALSLSFSLFISLASALLCSLSHPFAIFCL